MSDPTKTEPEATKATEPSSPPEPVAVKAAEPKAGDRVFLLVSCECYKGSDHGTGEFINAIEGDVIEVSSSKASQMLRDYPGDFEESTKSEHSKSIATKAKRAKAQVEAREKREAARAEAARRRAMDDDDLE